MGSTAIVVHQHDDHPERPGQYGTLTPIPLPARERGFDVHPAWGDRQEVKIHFRCPATEVEVVDGVTTIPAAGPLG